MQTPKSILLHLDGSARSGERTRVARQLGNTFDAEVTGLPCALPSLMRYPFAVEAATEVVAIMQRIDKAARDRLQGSFTAHSAGSPSMHWTEPLSDCPWDLTRRALHADLMVLSQRDPDDPMDSELPDDFVHRCWRTAAGLR